MLNLKEALDRASFFCYNTNRKVGVNMITPKELEELNMKLDELEKKIDRSIKNYHGWYKWEEAIIDGEYPVNARNAIGQKYKEAGWNYVYHITSSEHGDRPGLTRFIFSTEKPDDKVVRGFYIV